MNTQWFSLAVILLLSTTPGISVAQSNIDQAKLKEWIRDLDSSKFTTRERARQELLALGENALDPLKEALKEPDLELVQRRRLEKVLDELKVFERDGDAVHGLRLSLTASNDTLKIGDQMTLLTTLTNTGKNNLFIRVGGSQYYSDFTNGRTVHGFADGLFVPQLPKPDAKRKLLSRVIPPGTSVAYKTLVALQDGFEKKDTFTLISGVEETPLELPNKGPVRLRMVFTVEMDDAILEYFSNRRRFGEISPSTILWTGTVRSNDVEVRLVKAPDM
jgi:hypothetical protein